LCDELGHLPTPISEGRKYFFFEKKKQKTFKTKSFLVHFFKKELLSSFPRAVKKLSQWMI